MIPSKGLKAQYMLEVKPNSIDYPVEIDSYS